MELILALLLIAAAFVASRIAILSIRSKYKDSKPKTDSVLQSKLPVIGEAGSASHQQRTLIKKHGIQDLQFEKLSSEQASILLDCADYIEAIRAQESRKLGADLPSQGQNKALRLILDHNSYRERVSTWHQAHKAEREFDVPEDACQVAVVNSLTQVSKQGAITHDLVKIA